ncbi:hypothetical protein EON66_10910, partial [archaeon]
MCAAGLLVARAPAKQGSLDSMPQPSCVTTFPTHTPRVRTRNRAHREAVNLHHATPGWCMVSPSIVMRCEPDYGCFAHACRLLLCALQQAPTVPATPPQAAAEPVSTPQAATLSVAKVVHDLDVALGSKASTKFPTILFSINQGCEGNDAACDDFRAADGIPRLVRVLEARADKASIMTQACGALWRLAVNNDENKAAIAGAGAIPHLVHVLDAHAANA